MRCNRFQALKIICFTTSFPHEASLAFGKLPRGYIVQLYDAYSDTLQAKGVSLLRYSVEASS